MKILIRTDASVTIGTGHVMRCLTLADQFREAGHTVVFWMKPLRGNYIDYVQNQGYEVIQEVMRADVCIVDHYGLDLTWERTIRPYVNKIVVIDDLANRPHDCDVLLDQNIVPHYETRYNHLVPSHCVQMVGPDYLIMRNEFIEARKHVQVRTGEVKSLLVFMGGTDPTNETSKVLKALEQYNPFEEVHVVVGASNPNKLWIQQQAQKFDYEYHEQIDYMAQLMTEVDYSLGAGGSTTWERCFVGLPSTSTIVADNQREATSEAVRLGVACTLGWHEQVTSNDYKQEMKRIISGLNVQDVMSERGLSLTDAVTYPHPLILKLLEEMT